VPFLEEFEKLQMDQTQLEMHMGIVLRIEQRSFERMQEKMEELATRARVLRTDLRGSTAELHSTPTVEVRYFRRHAYGLLELFAFLSSMTRGKENRYSNHSVPSGGQETDRGVEVDLAIAHCAPARSY
jgi:hypothetical protein